MSTFEKQTELKELEKSDNDFFAASIKLEILGLDLILLSPPRTRIALDLITVRIIIAHPTVVYDCRARFRLKADCVKLVARLIPKVVKTWPALIKAKALYLS